MEIDKDHDPKLEELTQNNQVTLKSYKNILIEFDLIGYLIDVII